MCPATLCRPAPLLTPAPPRVDLEFRVPQHSPVSKDLERGTVPFEAVQTLRQWRVTYSGGFLMLRQTIGAVALTLMATGVNAQTYATGDSRSVSTPIYPTVCQTIPAKFSTSARSSPPSTDDTDRIQKALNSCAGTGESVVLAASGSNNAFYSGKLSVNGEGLVVSSGVTLEGNNSYSSQSELIAVTGTNSFIGGKGIIDGRGDLISGTPRLIQTSS